MDGSATLTIGAQRARVVSRPGESVLSRFELRSSRIGRDVVAANLRAARWSIVGRAIVTHTAPLSVEEKRRAALINCGPRAALTSFTAAASCGLRGWEREEIHVLVPRGARICTPPELKIVAHQCVRWSRAELHPADQRQRLAPALIIAAGSMPNPRFACAILAAAVQQRLARVADLEAAVDLAQRVRHRVLLRAALADIGMGAHALSEIDFVRICRRHGLPAPRLQSVRTLPDGRRRYLDVEWERPDGRRVVAEIDGALHLRALDWVNDQIRQNEIVLQDALVLRFPTVMVRTEEAVVVGQLGRALGVPIGNAQRGL